MRRPLPVPKDWKPYKFPLRPTVYRSAAGVIARAAWTLTPPYVKLGLLAAAATAGAVGLAGSSLRRVTKKKASKSRPMQTPEYGPGALPGGSAVGFQTPGKKRRWDDEHNVTVVDGSGYVQLTWLPKATVGSKLTRQELLNRHVEANMLTRIDRFQIMKKASEPSGVWSLSYQPDTATPNNYWMPLYTFELTSLCENSGVNPSGISCQWESAPFLRLKRNAGSGNEYLWDRLSGLQSNGVTGDVRWQYERKPYVAAGNNSPYNKCLLRWADIRMQFWGATNVPSSAEVMIVRFNDENIGPPTYETYDSAVTWLATHQPPSIPATASNNADYAQYQKFWTSQVDHLIGTPNMVRLKGTDSGGMSVLYRKVIQLNPTASYETATTGHQYLLKINYLMDLLGEFNHFNITNTKGDTAAADLSDVNSWPQDINLYENRSTLKNKNSRVFLMIRGLATKTGPVSLYGAGSAADNASFDLCVRRSVSLI